MRRLTITTFSYLVFVHDLIFHKTFTCYLHFTHAQITSYLWFQQVSMGVFYSITHLLFTYFTTFISSLIKYTDCPNHQIPYKFTTEQICNIEYLGTFWIWSTPLGILFKLVSRVLPGLVITHYSHVIHTYNPVIVTRVLWPGTRSTLRILSQIKLWVYMRCTQVESILRS